MTVSLSAQNTRGILLDIEGTTTPLAFVHDVLFPFARARVKDYLAAHSESDEIQRDLSTLRAEHAMDSHAPALTAAADSLIDYVYWLMDRDRKSTGLKSLQGKIWEQGYREGELKAEVFPDVPPALQRWREAHLRVAIFSSGSVLAQKLLFAHTNAGDLTPLIDGYFDTTTGAKNDAESYRLIATQLELDPQRVLFVSDVMTELAAADEAGMHAVLCIRPGNHPQPSDKNLPKIETFDEIES
jgi:enolase-phosphatase E1